MAFKIKPYHFHTLLAIALILSACKDNHETGSSIPEISKLRSQIIKSVAGSDSLLILSFDYIDKDGDIGLEASDTFPPFNSGSEFQYNLFLDVWQVSGSNKIAIHQPGTSDPEIFFQRIPNITPTGRNREIYGTIDIRLDASKNYLYPDTIECSIQIADRALHKSNVLESERIALQH
ncbi:MAG: hypothetical protein GC181_11150 [Bacteroidetes bacterium]|nr:hypothetical protein [Bacteroidota bacterium]